MGGPKSRKSQRVSSYFCEICSIDLNSQVGQYRLYQLGHKFAEEKVYENSLSFQYRINFSEVVSIFQDFFQFSYAIFVWKLEKFNYPDLAHVPEVKHKWDICQTYVGRITGHMYVCRTYISFWVLPQVTYYRYVCPRLIWCACLLQVTYETHIAGTKHQKKERNINQLNTAQEKPRILLLARDWHGFTKLTRDGLSPRVDIHL